jgi:hypothetical protein
MRRALALLSLTVLVAVSATTLASAGTTHHATDDFLGAEVQSQGKSSTYAFKVHASNAGAGAAITVNTSTSSTTGKTRGVAYFRDGSVKTAGTYRIASASSTGTVSVTFSGHDAGGTGAFKGIRGTFHGTGTYNPVTHTTDITLTTTYTL